MVEVQMGFVAACVGRQEYVFLPKLHSVCVLARDVECCDLWSSETGKETDVASKGESTSLAQTRAELSSTHRAGDKLY